MGKRICKANEQIKMYGIYRTIYTIFIDISFHLWYHTGIHFRKVVCIMNDLFGEYGKTTVVVLVFVGLFAIVGWAVASGEGSYIGQLFQNTIDSFHSQSGITNP